MSSASRPPCRRRARQAGFTLLEVMCAAAILAVMTGFITRVWFQSAEQGSSAVDLRELREAADTVFRRLCYEDGRHPDGLRDTLDNFYAGWADLRSSNRDRWSIYGMEYRRQARTAAGSEATDATSLFGEGSGSRRGSSGSSGTGTSGTGTSGTGTSGTGGSGSEGEKEDTGVKLWQVTLRIFLVDTPDEALITLQTFLPALEETGTGTGGTGTAR